MALLVNKAIKKLNLYNGNTGLMRKNEFKDIYKIFKNKYKLNVKLLNASKIFEKLKNVQIRKLKKIIGKLFIKILRKSLKN